ncbi:cache domain-containing protein [Desulfovibrio sp. JC010]|uniref:cache domain-containing protein n=1 Tax=Desulfovibrio sp. JC010 TaxID=2593641 RepID=UPI0013D5AFE6|nr:cache domain-containing protein [Desulfovibrio sp. JC010]NDV25416.1 PAS domain S-box protein [Desulfovibrio sp. JC010]
MKSIVSTLSRYMLSLCFSAIFIFGGLTVYFMITDYQREILESETSIFGGVEDRLVKEVTRVQHSIEFTLNNNQKTSIKNIKAAILEAHSLAENLYATYKETMNEKELKNLIKKTLNAMVFDFSDSYLFILTMDGTGLLNQGMPEIGQKNVLNMKTQDNKLIIQDMIDLIAQRDEGYIEYTWPRPGKDRTPRQKTSFIKLFKPFNWIIGTGIYYDTVTRRTQDEILGRLSLMHRGRDEIFAGTFDGRSLLGVSKGKNLLNLKDQDGVYIIKDLIRTAKTGGGFITYKTPTFSPTIKSYKKLSYCSSVPEWGWFLSYGIDVGRLEFLLKERKEKLWNTLLFQIAAVLALAFLISLVSIFFSGHFKTMLADNFNSLENFFRKDTGSTTKIDRSKIDFSEFDKMAELANSMIDSRESAKTKLLKSEITYREIFNSTKDAIGVLDLQKRVFTDVNQAFLDFFKMERMDAIGMSPEIISFNSPPYDSKYAAELFNKALSGESVHFEWMVRKSTGEPFWTDNLARVASIGGDKKLLVVMRDVTERRKMQKIMVQTEKMMSVGGLAAGMAHEINNPLGIIMQVTQNIIRRTSPTLKSNLPVAEKCDIDLDNLRNYMDKRGINEYLRSIQEAGTRAAAIVKSMLDFSRRSTSAKSSGTIEPVIETAISLASNDYDFKTKYDFKKINIIRDFNSSPMFNFTEMEISQVILNLIKNAAQALSEEKNTHKIPTITIRTSSDENFVRVEIEDNGPGMDNDKLKRVFEPFYSTKRPGVGTGLGLSVSYFIVTQNHGGTITADSTPGEGTRFTISLPILT